MATFVVDGFSLVRQPVPHKSELSKIHRVYIYIYIESIRKGKKVKVLPLCYLRRMGSVYQTGRGSRIITAMSAFLGLLNTTGFWGFFASIQHMYFYNVAYKASEIQYAYNDQVT